MRALVEALRAEEDDPLEHSAVVSAPAPVQDANREGSAAAWHQFLSDLSGTRQIHVSESEEIVESPMLSDSTEAPQLRLLVSSRHLCLASSTFRDMLTGPWQEGRSNSELIRRIKVEEWDVEAFLIVLDILHGQVASVPRLVSLELLAKIAAIVDYYNCHAAVEVFSDLWILGLQGNVPTSYGRECMLWMVIAWVFLRTDTLQDMVKIAIRESHGSLETMGLPLPEALLRTIELKRSQGLSNILQNLRNLHVSFLKRSDCHISCRHLLLGSLTMQMYEAGISISGEEDLTANRGFKQLRETVSMFKSPQHPWDSSGFASKPCGHNLGVWIAPLLHDSLKCLEDLGLEGVWSQRLKEREAKTTDSLVMRAKWKSMASKRPASDS